MSAKFKTVTTTAVQSHIYMGCVDFIIFVIFMVTTLRVHDAFLWIQKVLSFCEVLYK